MARGLALIEVKVENGFTKADVLEKAREMFDGYYNSETMVWQTTTEDTQSTLKFLSMDTELSSKAVIEIIDEVREAFEQFDNGAGDFALLVVEENIIIKEKCYADGLYDYFEIDEKIEYSTLNEVDFTKHKYIDAFINEYGCLCDGTRVQELTKYSNKENILVGACYHH